jgi:hypothetical protein
MRCLIFPLPYDFLIVSFAKLNYSIRESNDKEREIAAAPKGRFAMTMEYWIPACAGMTRDRGIATPSPSVIADVMAKNVCCFLTFSDKKTVKKCLAF